MIFVEEPDNRFYIGQSTIPNAGLGCFTKTLLKRGDCLEIIGVYVKRGSLADQCTEYARRYKFAGSENFNAKIVPMGFGAMVNHSDNPQLQNCYLTFDKKRLKKSEHAGQVFYVFTRDILPDEELIGNYGEEVGKEIQKTNEATDFLYDNKAEIARFLSYDLYDLKNIMEKICS